jgi:hypothetical protein
MVERESVVIHQLGEDEAQQRSFYRLVHNDRVETEEIKAYLYADCKRQVEAGKHYLVIQDTTQPNYERNRGNITTQAGLGVIGNNADLGFFLHPSLVVAVSSSRCIGYSNVITWSREAGSSDKIERNYPQQPIEDKESYRWIQAAQASQSVLEQAGQLTFIADREADINELFARLPDERTHLLIRACQDRRLAGDSPKLYAFLAQQGPAGSFTLAIKGDARTNRQQRKATIVLRWAKVALAPIALKGEVLEVYALEAREEDPPAGEKPILWRLLTTHPIHTPEQARQVTQWYSERWNIEQVFRLLKHQGLNVEMLDLESGKSLIQMTLLALLTVSKILLLHLASKQDEPLELAQSFTAAEIECMQALHQKYEGKTPKQKNPYPPNSLQWCYWIMARLGAWKPHEKKAGVITLMRGLRRFHQIFHGWQLAKQFVS